MNYTLSLWTTDQPYPTDVALRFSLYTTVVYVVIYLPLWFCIIFGNVLVVCAFWYYRELRKVQNYLLISLAVTDILTGIIALPAMLVVRLLNSPLTCFASTRFNFLLPTIVFSGSSIFHLIAIAIDRCLSLTWPLKYPRLVTACRVSIVIAIIWMINLLICCLPLYYPSPVVDQWVCEANDAYETEVTGLFLFITFTIPFLVLFLIILYAIMLRIAFNHIEKRRELTNHTDDNVRDAEARLRGIVTMSVVVGAFTVCWIPTTLENCYETFATTTEKKLITAQTFSEYASFGNSMVNSIIYGYLNQQFKVGFKIVLTAWGCLKAKNVPTRKQRSSGSGMSSMDGEHGQINQLKEFGNESL